MHGVSLCGLARTEFIENLSERILEDNDFLLLTIKILRQIKIKSTSIEYFRGLRNVDIPECYEYINLFLGINGAGGSE